MQHKWLTKLLGYDYEIMIKVRQDNKVEGALSRYGLQQDCSLMALIVVQTDWLNTLKQGWQTDRDLKKIIIELTNELSSHVGYSWTEGLLTYKGRLVVSSNALLGAQIMQEIHAIAMGGHSGT